MSKTGETVSFVYNEDGLRVQKTSSTKGTTNYTLHGKNVVHMTNPANGVDMHFFYDAQNRPAIVVYNGTPYYYLHNLQGDIIHIVDANGNNVVNYFYDAWGKKLSVTGSMAGTLGYWQPFRYRGYVYDEETGLFYLEDRYFIPILGRFVCIDDDVYETNLFQYCNNNPIRLSDESGHHPGIAFMNEMARIHDEVANKVAQKVGGMTARQYTGIPGTGRHGGYGYPDIMVSFVKTSGGTVWEVKPDSMYGHMTGPIQMRRYTTNTGYTPGEPVQIEPMQTTFFGKECTVTVTNGSSASGDAGVIYYKVNRNNLKPAPLPIPNRNADEHLVKNKPIVCPVPYVVIMPIPSFSLVPSRPQLATMY